MSINIKAFERAMAKAVEAKKQAAALSTSPAVKAPVVASKEEEKSKPLTQAELDYWVNLLMQHQKPKLSTTDRLIRDRLNAMGLAPNDD